MLSTFAGYLCWISSRCEDSILKWSLLKEEVPRAQVKDRSFWPARHEVMTRDVLYDVKDRWMRSPDYIVILLVVWVLMTVSKTELWRWLWRHKLRGSFEEYISFAEVPSRPSLQVFNNLKLLSRGSLLMQVLCQQLED